ncbi:hypothetical protein [Algibacter sp. PT7-4]|uniref:hypothetical protein n=1 Tax=Algibacter ulvanivorans TaxID=3400999 RepID=UPI003AB02E24
MTIKLAIPTHWNQLNNWQLKKLATLLHLNITGVLFDYKTFLILNKAKSWQLLKIFKVLKTIKNVGFSTLKQHYNWLYLETTLTKFIPKIKLKTKTLYAPEKRISNLTIDEFAHADDLFLGWHNTQDFEYLQYLTAVLYREKKYGKRVNFDKTELEVRAKSLKKINKPTLLAIALSYQGCRSHLTKQYPLVFPKPKTPPKTPPTKSGFGSIVLHLAGGKFGTHNETKTTNVYTFLNEFTEQLKKPHDA